MKAGGRKYGWPHRCSLCGRDRDLYTSTSKLLLVEGDSDMRLCKALMEKRGITGIEVLPMGGVSGLKHFLRVAKKPDEFQVGHAVERVGILVDADESAGKREELVMRELGKAKLPVPGSPLTTSTSSDGRITVVFLVAPSDGGAMEDMALESVRERPATLLTEAFFESIEARPDLRGPKASKMSKAKLQALLSTREEPYPPNLGVAAENGYWNLNHPVWSQLVELFRLIQGEPNL